MLRNPNWSWPAIPRSRIEWIRVTVVLLAIAGVDVVVTTAAAFSDFLIFWYIWCAWLAVIVFFLSRRAILIFKNKSGDITLLDRILVGSLEVLGLAASIALFARL